jgi:16S rRNA G966 N2-methylase RsmD
MCLSRGAGFTYFFEENLDTAHNLMQTLSTWSISNAKVVVKNVQYLPQAMVQVDLIFLDPPFGHKYTEQVMDRIAKKGWSSPKARLVVRSDYRLEHVSPYWLLVRHEQIGISHVHLYRVRDSGSVWDEVSALELLCQPDYEEG